MMKTIIAALLLVFLKLSAYSQNFPAFGPETKVFISGYASDAMEPFLSPDGNSLFFNSLNDGINTRLYYAARVDDSTFTYMGEVGGVNEPNNPQLNGVASLDTTGNFVWVSARNYPIDFDNLHRGTFVNDSCTSINRVHGNFYVYAPGWIVMDAMITYDGSELYYCNAFFDTCIGPCAGTMGIAARVNDSTFNTIPNSAGILHYVNDTNYIVYAPNLSVNGLELYYTRLMKGTFNTEICVSVRAAVTDTFSSPVVLHSELPNLPEAPTVNANADLMYYHKKFNGTFALFLRHRVLTGIEEAVAGNSIVVYPNPASDEIILNGDFGAQTTVQIFDATGSLVSTSSGRTRISVAHLAEGMYWMQISADGKVSRSAFSVCR